jgi:hypothetical protein
MQIEALSMLTINDSGLYIVTLNNDIPISVNAHDKRISDKCIKVTKQNCKFGKANNFELRRKNYFKTFSEKNVNFIPIARVKLEYLPFIEKMVLQNLDTYRMVGTTGRKNEWLENISFEGVKEIALETLKNSGISYMLVNRKL